MAFNPFLMETDYASQSSSAAAMYTSPAPPIPMDTSAGSSNPFLSFGAPEEPPPAAMAPVSMSSYMDQSAYGASAGADNPFLNYDMGPPPSVAAATASSNPFADFAAPAAPVATMPMSSGGMGMSMGGTNVGANAYFASTADMSYAHTTMAAGYYQQQPEPLQLIDTSEPEVIHSHQAQTTQNLLESVTGVLEATSDSLLDRLRVNAPSPTPELPSPTPSPRSPSPDLLGGDLMSEPPPVPPSSANPLAPSPHQLDSIMDLFDNNKVSSASSAPSSTHVDLMGLYNTPPVSTMAPIMSSNTVPPPKPTPMEVDTAPLSQPLVDFVIEPATPLIKEVPPQSEPPQLHKESLSPDEKVLSPPEKPPPPRPQPPSPVRSPILSPVHEVPPPRPTTAPPSRPAPPPAAPRSPVVAEKPLPSRPPPPVPPAPRATPSPQPPAYAAPPPPQPTVVQSAEPVVSATNVFVAPVPTSSPFVTSAPVTDSTTAAQPVTSTGGRGFDIFTSSEPQPTAGFSSGSAAVLRKTDTFDAFDAKFEQLSESGGNGGTAAAFGSAFGAPPTITTTSDSAWGSDGDSFGGGTDSEMGFGSSGFDPFLSMTEPPPVPQSTPAKMRRGDGDDDFDNDDEDKEMSITIRPRNENDLTLTIAPALAPPPKSPAISTGSAYSEENNTAYVPFLSQTTAPPVVGIDNSYAEARRQTQMNRTESGESPQTPLYEEDTSQPLEDFPRTKYTCDGWEMQVRYPNKKVTFGGNRSWKAVFVRVDHQGDIPVVKIYAKKGDKEPIQEIPLQSSYSVSDISAQQFDQYGKIFTAKLQFVYYKERPGVRPGQIGKASRLSHKLSAFAAYAITGDTSGVKEFGSDLKKLGLPLEHAPQVSQLVKLGTQSYDDMKQFSVYIEEILFHLSTHRDRALNYKTEEIQVTIVDEYYVEQDLFGVVTRQIARVRVMFLSFLNGVAEIEMGVNDMRRQGKEIVGRHDICPVPTEEWIRMEDIEFSNIVDPVEFEQTQTIKFKPPDASYLELMRFRVRPPRRRELPLQVKTTFITTGQRIEIRSDILVPGYTSRKLGQIPCEDVMVRFPIPETWIYMFRVEKHFRYGSVKSAHRRSGKVKGVERILGALDVVEPSLMETTSGQAKYEHHHRAIVWRIPRLPKEGQGAYTTHSFFCHITLQPHEKIPDNLSKFCYVEFTMPHTTVSHTVCRSISVPTSDEPPEKACRYLSRHEYMVEIEHREGLTPASYAIVPAAKEPEVVKEPERGEFEEQKFDSDFSDD